MAKTHSGTFRVPGGLSLKNPTPADDRDIVDLDSDLLSSAQLDNIYEGIIVYSKESKKLYKWNGLDRSSIDNWESVGSVELKEQVINLGGSYPNLSLEGNIIVFINTNAQAILKGIDPSVYKRITIVNNGDFTLGVESESTDAGVIPEHRIKLPTGNAFVGLEGTTEFGYIESIQRWQILDSFASKWVPAHRGLTEEEVLKVGEGGVSSTGKIFQLIDFRDAQSSAMTKQQLNDAYGLDMFRGFQVICKAINKIYIKVDESANDWQEITTTNVL